MSITSRFIRGRWLHETENTKPISGWRGMTSVAFCKQGQAFLRILVMTLVTSSAFANSGIDILIDGNPKLQSLVGMEGVIAVNSLAIKNNPLLTNLNPLVNLDKVLGAMDVQSNIQLSNCKALAPVLDWPSGIDPDVGSAGISGNAIGCMSEAEILGSVLGPRRPVINGETFSLPSGGTSDAVINMELDFTPAVAQEAIFPVTGHRATCSSTESESSGYPPMSLLDGVPVTQVMEVSGSAGRSVSSFVADIEVLINITHSDPVDLLVTLKNPEGMSLVLWDNSSPGSEDLIGTFPTSLAPAEPLSTLARERMGGEWTLLVEDTGIGPIIREGFINTWGLTISEESVTDGAVNSPITVPGVGHSVDYTCTLTALSRLGATPESVAFQVQTVPRLPPQPSIVSTDFDDGEVYLFITVGNTAVSSITRYDASCTDGQNTFTGSSVNSRVVVSGLTNGDAYTCTVTVTNILGASPVSVATAPITPQASEISVGLPIWLIYQATQ